MVKINILISVNPIVLNWDKLTPIFKSKATSAK